jgi:hypothetical protein
MLRYLILPAARFCVRHSIRLPEIVDVFKRCFVEAAQDALRAEGVEPTAAKVSVMTGVHRKDIRSIVESAAPRIDPLGKHPLVRLLSFWNTDEEFFDTTRGAPRVLTPGDGPGSVGALVRRVGGDANPYSLLYALDRSGLVRRALDGSYELLKSSFSVPTEAGWEMIAELIGDGIECLEHNVDHEPEERNLQLKTVFDNIPARFVDELRREIRERGGKFQEEIRSLLARYDRDMNSSLATIEDESVEVSCSVFGVVRSK